MQLNQHKLSKEERVINPTDYEYENMPEGIKFMGRDFSEFQTPKPLENEFQRQSEQARGLSNESDITHLEELMGAHNLGSFPETIDDKDFHGGTPPPSDNLPITGA